MIKISNQDHNDIWKHTSKQSAQETLDSIPSFAGDIIKARVLENACNKMSDSLDNIIADQNEYIIEMQEELNEINLLEEEFETEIKKLTTRQEELLAKQKNGTITEEEEDELLNLNNEIAILNSTYKSELSTHKNNFDSTLSDATQISHDEKLEIATDYGETAVEKGNEFAATKDKRKSFWRKLSGSWDKSAIREAGKELANAGENLLDKVDTTSNMFKNFTHKTSTVK